MENPILIEGPEPTIERIVLSLEDGLLQFKIAQQDFANGNIRCRRCNRISTKDNSLYLCNGDNLVFAVCLNCARTSEIVIEHTGSAIKVKGRNKQGYELIGK